MATSSTSNSDAEDSRQSWDITNANPICLSTISKRKSAFLPYKPNTGSPPAIGPAAATATATAARPALPASPASPTDAASSATPSATPSGTPGPNNSCVLTNLQRGNTEAPLAAGDIALSFHERCGQGEVTDDQVAALERGAAINSRDQYQYTPLHWAAHYGQLHTVQQLVRHGAQVNRLAPDHVSALLLAAAGGHHEVVRCLLQHGADAQHTDIVGNTALMFAAAGNHPHTTNELLGGGQRNLMATNEEGESAYSLAVQNRALLAQAVLENYIVSMLAGS